MEFRLSIQILNATQVLEAVKNVPQKKISNKRKAEIENNFNKEVQSTYPTENLDQLKKNKTPLLLSYYIHRNEYLYWLALKISLTETKRIQSTLNYALQTASESDLFNQLCNHVKTQLENEFKWITKSNMKEFNSWLELTLPANSKSIFHPRYKELLLLELEPQLDDPADLEALIQLIYYNHKPKQPIIIRYNSLGEFCAIFSFLHGKNYVKLSQRELSKWIYKYIRLVNPKHQEIKGSDKTIKKYIEENRLIPNHLKVWQ